MQEQFDMLTDKGYIRRYAKTQFEDKKSMPPKGWEFPTQFRSIVQETSTVIGISDEEEKILGRYVTQIDNDDDDGQSSEMILDDDSDTMEVDNTPIESNYKNDDSESDDRDTRPRNNNRNNNRNRNGNNRNGNRAQQAAQSPDAGENKKPRNRRPFNKNKNKPKPKAE